MCCVLSCLEVGFLLIVGVGGREPHESALQIVGVDDTLYKTTSHSYNMRKHRKNWGFWDMKHKMERVGDLRITLL